MAYIAKNPTAFLGQSVGTGQCVALVEKAAGTPQAKLWSRGVLVKGAVLAPGTIIATFDPDGRYGSHTDGRSHAAIYIGQDAAGIQVIDQWMEYVHHVPKPHLASRRTIAWKPKNPKTKDVDVGDMFYVVQ